MLLLHQEGDSHPPPLVLGQDFVITSMNRIHETRCMTFEATLEKAWQAPGSPGALILGTQPPCYEEAQLTWRGHEYVFWQTDTAKDLADSQQRLQIHE